MLDDTQLLAQWGEGDKKSGEILFRRHFDSISRFFQNKVSSGADDLVQRTFRACVEKRDRIRDMGSFRAFLFGVARYELLMELRTRARHRAHEIDFCVSSMRDLDPSPSQLMLRRQVQRQLFDALRQLPVETQITLELHYWDGLTVPEIADATDAPIGTVKSRLRNGRLRLLEQLGQLVDSL